MGGQYNLAQASLEGLNDYTSIHARAFIVHQDNSGVVAQHIQESGAVVVLVAGRIKT